MDDLIRRGEVLKKLQRGSRSYEVVLREPAVHIQGNEEPKPLPCPFCGKYPNVALILSIVDGMIAAEAHVVCKNCEIEFLTGRQIVDGSEVHISGFDALLNDAVERWNGRA